MLKIAFKSKEYGKIRMPEKITKNNMMASFRSKL